MGKILEAIQLATPQLERAAEHVLHPFRPLLDANPRAMKGLVKVRRPPLQ
jgi:hypothetical protein